MVLLSRVFLANLDGALSVEYPFKKWRDDIKSNFHEYFYIPLDAGKDVEYKIKTGLVNRRGIYKDTYNSKLEYGDYQFRPNFTIAMMVSPELFVKENAIFALGLAKNVLMGPLGIKTLDPLDWNYRGVYDNANDSTEASVAHGFNYHNGPEWCWIQMVFLRASVSFMKEQEFIKEAVEGYQEFICDSRQTRGFMGIPELTNANGEYCVHSCETQTWSNAVLMMLVSDL